jgi:hypothetical protein
MMTKTPETQPEIWNKRQSGSQNFRHAIEKKHTTDAIRRVSAVKVPALLM